MEKRLHIQKHDLLKLTTVLWISCFILLGTKANAQCQPSFGYVTNSSDGVVYFIDSSSASPGANYYWSFGDGTSSSSVQNPVHTFPNSGTYQVCLSLTDSVNFCSNSFCDSVVVINTTPSCNASFYKMDSAADTYLVDQSTGAFLAYSWNFGDGTYSTTAGTQIHHYPGMGTYYPCLTVTNPGGTCTSTFCDSIVISSCHTSFTSTMDTISNGFAFNSTSTGSINTYSWNFGDGTVSTLANPYHLYPANGWYLVQLTATSSFDSTCFDTHSEYVHATNVCDANFTIVHDSTNIYNIYVYNTSYGNLNANYLWDFGDGTTSNLQYPTHTYAISSAYSLCLTVYDANGCTDTFCDSIVPGHGSGALNLTVLAPLATGVLQTQEVSSVLENYPNPFNGNTTINYSIPKDAFVELYVMDLLGNKIAAIENTKRTAGNYSVNWNAENVSSGLYLLQMKVNNKVITKKIIIQ